MNVNDEMPNIETLKYIIEKLQKNMASAINDDEILETDNDTGDLDNTKRDFLSLNIYNAVYGSVSLDKFRDFLSCNNIEDVYQLTYD